MWVAAQLERISSHVCTMSLITEGKVWKYQRSYEIVKRILIHFKVLINNSGIVPILFGSS